ncbi:MAG: bifunctional rhamnulose-1-phosphate aldolase/short-chain dehydrogenase [Nitrospirota bacterium]
MRSHWSDREARGLEGLDALVYATRTIGAEPELVLWGGGNSSAKLTMQDHAGRETRVLWIKGSGSDMRTITAKQFTPLRLDELLLLFDRETMTDEAMVAYQAKCILEPTAPKPSIETLLHAFVPAPHVYHTHADSICALVDTSDSEKIIKRVYGTDAVLIPYVRPGFALAKLVGTAYRKDPRLSAIILDKHGLVTWGNSPKEAYLATIRVVSRAERFIQQAGGRSEKRRVVSLGNCSSARERQELAAIVAPVLRGAIGQRARMLLMFDDSPAVLRFVNGPRARQLSQVGPFTPDHILHTKARPLFLDLPRSKAPEVVAQAIRKGVERYRQDYIRYFERYKSPSVTMMDPHPRVILVSGLGLFTSGKDRRACRIAHDLYVHTMRVIRASSVLDTYTSLSSQDLCDFEYWPMENFKLTLLPPEKEFSRRIVLVTGAAGAIGRAISQRFVAEGAAVILADLDQEKISRLCDECNRQVGEEHAVPLVMDVADRSSVTEGFQKAVRCFGGLDVIVSNAGIACSAPVERMSLRDWTRVFEVNATGHLLICQEAVKIFKRQGLAGNIVVVASKNVVAPGKEFGAYSASKAAQAQLSKILAIEGAESGIRVNMVNPDGVFEGSGLWSERVREQRAKVYGVPVEKIEEYYASRNLLKTKVTAADVAEAVLFFASQRSAKTTGAMLPVDGGVKEAFPR